MDLDKEEIDRVLGKDREADQTSVIGQYLLLLKDARVVREEQRQIPRD